ncbi:MAG: 6,7-dimethyl-8-ribityllumazine synthase [Gemmatimonadales bacterium]|nr:6,7-dimethyl-8-ribityllumazine synthase [Gemmatimonadales bacterium]
MPEYSGRPRPIGRVAVLVSRYNEVVTGRLLDGARECLRDAGVTDESVDVVWVPGAFELAAAASAAAATGSYACIVALGAVIRGDTPHFDFVAGEAARGLGDVAVRHGLPVAFGVLTVDSLSQATDRAGGSAGNKGYEAAAAALETADVIAQLRGGHGQA